MKTLLIDASSILYKYALTSNKYELTTSTGTVTTCVYSFLSEMLDLCDLLESNRIIVVFDSRENLRKGMCNTYKANRKEVPEEVKERRRLMYEQIPILRDFLSLCNIPCIESEGYEADDVIASFVYNNPDTEFVTVCSDHDLWQTIRDNNIIFNPSTKRIFRESDFQVKFPNFKARDYWKILSIAGCSTDHVEGINGVGEITAYKYLTKQLKDTSKAYNRIIQNKETAYFTQKLVQLPLEGCPIHKVEYTPINVEGFCTACTKYEFESFLNTEFSRWMLLFNMR